ncbi:MAG: hypothetical protein M1837_006684 [Sclerophora amabilis]|nr:MAG: hypothetical protein M1837_006684 [Sclerophora amabilis]
MAPTTHLTRDANVSFEEFLHYAKITRAEEMNVPSIERNIKSIFSRKSTKKPGDGVDSPSSLKTNGPKGEKGPGLIEGPTEDEWTTASRAARSATWGAVFYLITTDILGPYSVPGLLAGRSRKWDTDQELLFMPSLRASLSSESSEGVAVGKSGSDYFSSGFLIWRLFLNLDSHQYPLKTYGDLFFRIYGKVPRYLANTLQSIQLVFNVGIIILSNGQGLSQVSSGKVCFSVLCVIWTIAGLLLGQIRTLQKYGWVANSAVWINILVIFITMGVVTHTEPNYTAGLASNNQPKAPVVHTAGPPSYSDFPNQVVGLMQAVFSYGGAMIFCELMAEMRRPYDFWKGMITAQILIFCLYIFFGVYVYGYQGQFAINPAIQGISPYGWQTAMNVLYMVSSLVAAGLYGNIGIKVLYVNIFQEIFNGPGLNTRAGKLLWVVMVPIYWALAFIIASAIPQFSALSAILGASCIMQFTYTFPPLLTLGFAIKQDAILPNETFDPATGHLINQQDSGLRRWTRGFSKRWPTKILHILYFLGSATTAILGIYSAALGLVSSYSGVNATSSFGCKSPVGA